MYPLNQEVSVAVKQLSICSFVQGLGAEKQHANCHVRLHVPAPDCGPRSPESVATSSEGSGLLHRHAEGEG